MCGIAGIVSREPGGEPVSERPLIAMREQMRARGPDDAGIWLSPDRRVGLAHRRLAIIDPGQSGHQPMVSDDRRLVITFNGEIYNFRTLRAGLISKGVHFRTDSDTEVLIELYRREGAAMTGQLRGMYAFCIWDQRDRSLFLARDPYGIKPLYYALDAKRILFASQVGALREVMGSLETDPVAEAGFLLTGSVMEPRTIYRDVQILPAGHSIRIDHDGIHAPDCHTRISDLLRYGGSEKSTDPQSVVGKAVHGSVQSHLVADVPVGSFLSAGIDSGVISSVASSLMKRPLHGVTLGFDEYRNRATDEVPLASAVARKLGGEHTIYRVNQQEFEQDLPGILAAMDQPTIDGINTWFVSKAAAASGLKVMLSGIGGDELFGGYPSFRDLPRWRTRLGWLRLVPGRAALFNKLGELCTSTSIPAKAFGLAAYAGSLSGSYLVRRGLFMPWELEQFMGAHRARYALQALSVPECFNLKTDYPGRDHDASSSSHRSISALESCFYLRNQLLRDTDWASMAHSLEIRTPLVDHVLTRETIAASAAQPGKQLLARAAPIALPDQVLNRPKTGFTTPMPEWIAASKKLDHWRWYPALRADHTHWSRRYAASIHAHWFRGD